MPYSNGNSFNGNSAFTVAAEDPVTRSMPYLFRVGIPGFCGGWPA